jgi:hypothetical protein
MYEHRFAFADAFTRPAKVEGGPRRRLNMVEERLSRHILVATRACRVGTSGHSTVLAAGVGKSCNPQVVNVYEYNQASR